MENDNMIFKYLKPFDNDQIHKLQGKELQDFLNYLNDFYLVLRDNLGLDKSVTFGLELEYENILYNDDVNALNEIRKKLEKTSWITTYDSSLNLGIEINSPILHDKKESWLYLNNLISFLKPLVSVGDKSGGHIHVGTQALGDNREDWLYFLKLWSIYENIIYRFTNGDFLNSRKSMKQYAMPMMRKFYETYNILKDSELSAIINYLKQLQRYQAVNFVNVNKEHPNDILYKNTIEFRSPNSSLNSVVWQNNVNLFTKMLLHCKNNHQEDIVNNRFVINNYKYSDVYLYDEIYLDQVLEFCDIIFDNNIDKIYFLRQYFKSFEVDDVHNHYGIKKENFQKKKEIKFSL